MQHTTRNRLSKYAGRALIAFTAVAALIIGAVHVHFNRMSATPYDLRLLGQSELLAGSTASLRLAVFDRDAKRPMPGVPVEVALYDPANSREITLASFTTDGRGSGSPRLKLPDWEAGSYQLRVTATPDGVTESLSRLIELKRRWRLMLSTDKPVYQPGQTIRIRSLALKKPDLKPLAGQETLFTITDPKGNVIFKQADVTSKFGISSTDCPLAVEILEGEYAIQCGVGQTTSERTVTVEKYVLPKFKLAVNLDKPFYSPGENVTGSIQADYFFGKPVAGAKVEIGVGAAGFSGIRIASITEKTDQQGKAQFQFRLPDRLFGQEQDDGNARFALVAAVTDTAGQQCFKHASRIVTVNPIQLEVIPESGMPVKGLPNLIYVFTSYADGRPAKARLVVHGLDEEIETNDLGIASFELTPETDDVRLTLRAIDAEGRMGREQVDLRCGSPDGDFLVRPDKAVYDGGQTMTLTALGGGVEPVFVDLIKDGQTMLTQVIEVQEGRGWYQFDLPPELFGTIQVCAYRFRGDGLARRKSRMIYVRQAEEISVNATLDQAEYRPGTKATLKLSLSDSNGKPAPGAISLQAVDEAVYSVLGQQTGMEETFFLLEQELLEPVYVIYPGWSPELFSELPLIDRNRFEQAVFATTVRQAGGVQAIPRVFSTGDDYSDVDAPPLVEEMEVDEMPVGEQADLSPDRSPFTLAAASFPAKARGVEARRQAGLEAAVVAWVSLGVVLALFGLTALGMFFPRAFFVTSAVFLGLALLIGLSMSALVRHEMMARQGAMVEDGAMEWEDDWGDAGAEMAEGRWFKDEATPPTEAPMAMPGVEEGESQPAAPPRVRRWFPETLLWRPELITDDNGEATLEIELADSITTWRLSTSAVSGQGQLGGAEFPIKVFQPFFVDLNLPVALTRNDEVGVPVVVYNYLDQPQTVELAFQKDDWFEPLQEQGPPLTLELNPGEVRSLNFPLKVLRVGQHELEVTATGSGMADAVRRQIEVLSDGRKVEQIASGTLLQPFEVSLEVPENAIEGSVRAIVKLYPSSFSQLVEGLDAIFQMPSGCFEQTSSTTYPNILALDYLRRTDKSLPQVEAKAREYIHVGYQRLISFEVDGGGFDWFGSPPANRTLTAYGLMEFNDMAQVHDVDPQLINRTRQWLLAQRKGDGSWPNEANMLDDGLAGSVNRGGNLDLAATAYIAWAVFSGGAAAGEAAATLDFLLAHEPHSIDDPYLLAITANAIASIDPNHGAVGSYLARLDDIKQTGDNGKLVWWSQPAGSRTTFHGSGLSGNVETTAMATLALLGGGQHSATARAALAWLIEQKDPNGTWHSTQATVLALKTLLAGTGAALGDDQQRKIDLALGGETVREITIAADQSEVMRQINLSDMLTAGSQYQLALTDLTDTGVGYQMTFRYHVEEQASDQPVDRRGEPLSINIEYDRERLNVDETVTAVAVVTNNMEQSAPMVILDLPIPGGFAIDPGELDELVGSQKIARYQITARKAIVYLRQLAPGESLKLGYRLRATMPVKVTVPDAQVYEYYDPQKRGRGGSTHLEVGQSA